MPKSVRHTIPILIPAYKPGPALETVVRELLALADNPIIIVDDGSGPEYRALFERIAGARVHLLRHAVNLGKGAALKTGLNYVHVSFPDYVGVVTVDADGQHLPDDVVRVADRLSANPGAVVMGVRAFSGEVPWRSRIGNRITSVLMRVLLGQSIVDTQTGLRGIPAAFVPHLLRLQSSGYEFELDMLIGCKYQDYRIVQESISTVYLDGNSSSHFHPLFDSMRIYFLLFRFGVLSILTAVLDNVVFAICYSRTGSIGESQIAGRSVAMVLNYLGARAIVFHSRQRHAIVLPKYVAVVMTNGLLSYGLIELIHSRFGTKTILAKLVADGVLFIINFTIQRDLVFTRRKTAGAATDWDNYYNSVPVTARLTRRYTTAVLLAAIKRHAEPATARLGLSILEIGGANSCFLNSIVAEINCSRYDVVDTNRYGLSLLEKRGSSAHIVRLHEKSVLGLSLDHKADLVFSVGLVEHFQPEQTREAIQSHFNVLRPGGTVIITFPTATLLYRITRGIIESFGMWKFPDERPLDPSEVAGALRECADVVYQKTLWPLILTQHLIVARKHS